MEWSFSKGKTFNKCQRKWYYYELFANSVAKDPARREAYILKQLQSVSAWRGRLVDLVIEEKVVPSLKSHIVPEFEEVFAYAKDLIQKQIEFGKMKCYRENGTRKNSVGSSYCAFYDVEYNSGLDEKAVELAVDEIKKALSNLIDSELILNIANENEYVVSQRTLKFNIAKNISVVCIPDMLVFYEKNPPLIIDWKVHFFGNTDAQLQLGIYSIALSKATPHKDFPKSFQESYWGKPCESNMLEYQLLKNVQRRYSIDDSDILDIEDYIFRSSSQMVNLVNGKGLADLDLSIFKTPQNIDFCGKCQFKKLCWKHEPAPKPKPLQQTLMGVFS